MKPFFRKMTANLGVPGEFVSLLWQRRLWWMIPMVMVLLLFGVFMVFVKASGIAPFLYTVF